MTDQPATGGIVARGVCKSFGSHVVLDNVSVSAKEGTIPVMNRGTKELNFFLIIVGFFGSKTCPHQTPVTGLVRRALSRFIKRMSYTADVKSALFF